ncbi:hypothetical protein [Streptomyces griseorubiginosus]|uniref:hypothetical protein n=1 Tax=Streptomyces griseorubiginosus TaxID=67304 RepID=UPI00364ED946
MQSESIPHPRRIEDEFSRATRDACTVPHFNEFMGELFIEQLLRDDLHAVVPAMEIDVAAVLQNCLDARRRRQVRDLKLLTIAVCGSTLSLALTGLGASFLVPFPVVGMLVIAYCVVRGELVDRQTAVRRLTGRRPPAPQSRRVSPWVAARLAVIHQAQTGNLSVHRDFSPFQGFGPTRSAWSLTVRLQPQPQRSPAKAKEFTAEELSEHVKAELSGLHTSPHHGERTRYEDRVFVRGDAIPPEWMLIHDRKGEHTRRPRTEIAESEVKDILNSPRMTARHYLCMHTSSWEGEFVASSFLHASIQSETLYIDFHQTVLGPVRLHPQARDLLNGKLPRKRETSSEAAFLTLPWLLLSPFRALNRWRTDVRLGKRRRTARTTAAEDPAYDYSTWFSLRESVNTDAYDNCFQKLDVDRQCKTAQLNILAGVIGFLDAHDVDTSEFRKQQTSILNHGVLQLGGVSNVKAQAVGTGAQAVSLDAPPAE